MQVVGPGECRPAPQGAAVTIGAYDGVHVGHRALLGQLCQLAARRGTEAVVVTFDRHPAMVVRPESAPPLLTDLEQKLELLASCGVDRTLVLPFDRRRADETAEEFVSEVLVGALGARVVVVGEDFHFGHGRKGNVSFLREQGAVHGFDVEGFKLADRDGGVVSSTRIRALLAAGRVEEAADLLGRYHEVRGVVVHGDGRGGPELGMPTANLEIPDWLAMPAEGVYAGWYTAAAGARHRAAVSWGRRPTFHQGPVRSVLEAHLLDFSGDLYGQPARLSFTARLHEERRYDSTEALIQGMRTDVDRARAILSAG